MKLLPHSDIFIKIISSFFSKQSMNIANINIQYDLINFKEGHINIECLLKGHVYEYNQEYNLKYSFKLINKEETKLEDLIAATITYLIINHGITVHTLGYYFEDTVFPLLKEYGLSRNEFDNNELYKNYLKLKMVKELNK